METKGKYIVLRSMTKGGDLPLSYSTDSLKDANDILQSFLNVGFNARIIDCDEEFARA